MAGDPAIELLVLQAQAGDEAAFAALVDRCHGALYRQARRWLCDGELCRDAVQDTWCSVVRGLPRLEDPARFRSWALAIATRRAIDLRRRRRPERALPPDAEPVAADAAAGHRDEGERLRAAVARLDFDHRVVVELHYLEGLSLPEVAEVLGVPPGTVKSRAFHARQRLRAALGGPGAPQRGGRGTAGFPETTRSDE